MALENFGSGLGQTSTKSMKRALKRLGFCPCHPMVEVSAPPESVPLIGKSLV